MNKATNNHIDEVNSISDSISDLGQSIEVGKIFEDEEMFSFKVISENENSAKEVYDLMQSQNVQCQLIGNIIKVDISKI